MINHLKMNVNKDKILKEIISQSTDTCQWKFFFKTIILWKLSPAIADTFFKPMSIPLKWSRQVADRSGRFVLRYQLNARGENPFKVTVW